MLKTVILVYVFIGITAAVTLGGIVGYEIGTGKVGALSGHIDDPAEKLNECKDTVATATAAADKAFDEARRVKVMAENCCSIAEKALNELAKCEGEKGRE